MKPRKTRDDVIDSCYGWVVASSFAMQAIATSLLVAYSVLMVEFTEVFGLSKATISVAPSVHFAFFCLAGICIATLTEKYGIRPICFGCSVIASGGLLITSFSTNIYVLSFTYGAMCGLGNSGIILCSTVIIQLYFDKKRGFAAGLASVGGSVASILTAPVYEVLINHFGWRGAVTLHAGLVLQGAVFSLAFRPLPSATAKKEDHLLAERNFEMAQYTDNCTVQPIEKRSTCARLKEISIIKQGRLLFRNKLFVLFMTGNMMMPFGVFAMLQHTPGRAAFKGMDRMQGALAVSAIGMCSLFGRLATALILRLQCTNRMLFTFAVVLGGGVILLVSCLPSSFYPYATTTGLYGSTLGSYLSMTPTVMVDLVGREMAAPATGWSQTASVIPSFIASPFLGWLYDVTGDYDVPFYMGGAAQALAALVFLTIYIIRWRAKQTLARRNEVPTKGTTVQEVQ